MAGYSHHPNMGHPNYNTANSKIQNLNTVPSDYEMALQQQRANGFDNGTYDFQSDLDMFTNTQFFDFEMAEVPETSPNAIHGGDMWPVGPNFMNDPAQVHGLNNFNTGAPQPSFPQYPIATASTTPTSGSSSTTGTDANKPGSSTGSKELKETTSSPPNGLEEVGREAAEEDKRRRNTAASARFRVKKKQREQALEKTAKDMTDRVTYLENRVSTLELENKLLKDLITEKSGVVPEVTDLEAGEEQAPTKPTNAAPAKRKDVKIETKEAAAAPAAR